MKHQRWVNLLALLVFTTIIFFFFTVSAGANQSLYALSDGFQISSIQATKEPTIDDIFSPGQCTNYAAHQRSELFPYIRDYYPGQWDSGRWDNNFQALYDDGTTEYVVDDVPEVGAVAVWDPYIASDKSTVGHVGIVESIVDSENITVRDANWNWDGKVISHPVQLKDGIHFIHTIPYSRGEYEQRTGGPSFVNKKDVNIPFKVINPERNVYVTSVSEFMLEIDGHIVLSSQRPTKRETFSTSIWLNPFLNHTAKVEYYEGEFADGSRDPAPEFVQTWWPNSLAQAAEPETPQPVNVNYIYTLEPQFATVGQQVSIKVGSQVTGFPTLVTGIQAFVDGTQIGEITGQNGVFNWNTNGYSAGQHQLKFKAKLIDYQGDVNDLQVNYSLLASGNSGSSSGVDTSVGACSASSINSFLAGKGSPMKNEGNAFIVAGKTYNVDPRFVVAISNAESTYGRNGDCATQRFNAWGYGGGWPSCWAFGSWGEASNQVTATVGNTYFRKYNQVSISDFVNPPTGTNPNSPSHCYCCSGCQNWIGNVKSAYKELGGNPETNDLTLAACSNGSSAPPTSSNLPPNKPSLVSPSNWVVSDKAVAQLCAQNNGDPNPGDRVVSYRFMIFDSAQNWDSNWVSSSCVNTPPLGAANYQWHVKVGDTTGAESDWSDTWNFTITSQQSPLSNRPTLLSPANEALLPTAEKVVLHWNSATNATGYKVEVWGGPYQTMTPCDWQNGTSCQIGQMWPGTMSWHVKARNTSGQETDWSDTWSFTIQDVAPPSADRPTLSSPENGAQMPQSTQVVLRWNSTENATAYKVEVWGGPYETMIPCDWQSGTSCQIGQMWPGTISWHVKARNSSGQETEWSDTWSFTIQESPPPPSNPGFVELLDNLSLRAESSGTWPPQPGDKLIAHIKVRNGGDLPIHIEHIGVRGRQNGGNSWDIGFWTADLNGRQEWSLDPNNERPLEPGDYSFRISYTLDGSKWTEIGNEINFSVRNSAVQESPQQELGLLWVTNLLKFFSQGAEPWNRNN